MKNILIGAFILAFSQLHASISLYNGELPGQDVTTQTGASDALYNPSNDYALHAFNSANITYTQEAAGTTFAGFGEGQVLKMTTNGGVDAALRYNFAVAQITNFVDGSTPASPLLLDLQANPVLQFDIIWDGEGQFATVGLAANDNGTAPLDGTFATQNLTANEATTVSFDLSTNAAYTNWLASYSASATPTSSDATFAQIRLTLQTSSSAGGTFAIDNVQAVPEPQTFALLAGCIGLAFALRRRQGRS